MRACASQDGSHDDNVMIVWLRSWRRHCRHVAVVRASACVPSRRNGEHEWASGDDNAVAIVRLRSSRCRCHRVAVASTRGVWGRAVRWVSTHDDAMAIVRSRLSRCRRHHITVASARECGPGRGQGNGEGGARAGRGRGAHEVGAMRGIWAVHIGSLRAGEGCAHWKGDASGGGGERGCAGGRGGQ